ncbi:MAG: tannase/feruloyl esterase family alpha/beta hydrolase [Acidobacteriota bacterium]|jgi:feruloyl esterase|nr:tannase/feruloyl esterase family alpha/beta hydrolase [Acidobacteriota bacterium]
MKPRCTIILSPACAFLAACVFGAAPAPAADREACVALAQQRHDHVTIVSAAFMDDPAGFAAPPTPGVFGTPPGLKVMAPFCRVTGFIEPVRDSHIGFEVWLPPRGGWNARYLAVGNPAFEGAIKYQGLARALAQGYATASTDTGHQDPGHAWAMGRREALIDWTHRAVHETTVVAKRLIQAFYGRAASYAYWDGCHNGGRQGLTEAQLHPEDFDGIVAGDPAYHLTRLQAGSEYLNWVALKDGTHAPGYLPPAKYPALHRAVLDACDAKDGVKDDAIEDPTRCRFDPASIRCPGPDNLSCLTEAQVETVRRIYEGARLSDGTQVYTGFEPGSELLWNAMVAGPEPLDINNDFFRYIAFEDPEWDFRSFDLESDARKTEELLGGVIDTVQTDLSAFKARGGRLLMYQGWNETWIPPRMATVYRDKVAQSMGGAAQVDDFFRLFMVPDYGMCAGNSSSTFDALGAVRRWREEGVAPDHVVASYSDGGVVYKRRPVCPYPQVAIYKGDGDAADAGSFRCGAPDW